MNNEIINNSDKIDINLGEYGTNDIKNNENDQKNQDYEKENDDGKDNDDNDEEESKEEKKKLKKREKHYFKHHISKILKEVCPERDITLQAKIQMNKIVILTIKIITNKLLSIMKSNGKKTICEDDLESSIKLVFTGQLCQKSVEDGYKCLNNYKNSVKSKINKGKSRNEKADILLPPSLLEKFLKIDNYYISSDVSVFFAGVIEYFISQILELASLNNKNIRITTFDIENGIKLDKEFYEYFTKNNIYLYGSGIIPYINPKLMSKINNNDNKAIKIITKVQENNNHIFTKTFIENKFKSYISLIYPDIRYQKDCFDYFHDYLEKWIVELLKYSHNITLYSRKTRINSEDIELALSIMERRQPSFFNFSPENKEYINFDEVEEED